MKRDLHDQKDAQPLADGWISAPIERLELKFSADQPGRFSGYREMERLSERLQHASDDVLVAGDRFIGNANRRIEQLRLEIDLTGKSEGETARLRMEQNLLVEAMDKTKRISPEQRAEISALAGQYGSLTEELQRAREAEQQQLDQIAHHRDLVGGAMMDIRRAMADGKITAQEWGDIWLNMIGKVADRLQNQLLDAIFNVNSASMGGGGGGIFGPISSLFGFGTPSFSLPARAPIPTSQPVRTFAGGGIVGRAGAPVGIDFR